MWAQAHQEDAGSMKTSALAAARRPAEIALRDRLIVALDVPDEQSAFDLVRQLGEAVSFYKIGLQLQFAGGLQVAARLIDQGKKVFLDAKICDIDETVRKAVANVARMGVDFVTVHGNSAAIRAALEGRGKHSLKVLSVTLLTSLDARDMQDLGLAAEHSIKDIVLMRARSAVAAGCDGVIASGLEAAAIRDMAGERLLIVAPGIRSCGAPCHDQKRVATPRQAITAGADYIVMGRQIIENDNPGKMAEAVFAEIEAAIPR